ncbi:MAG: sulfatase-like hydrolase/transferase [Chloroflexi bacterium]|nr:sulfatase-like hydrolase/transferase [Chloroflexota bacterium]
MSPAVLIVIDGLRPEAIEADECPNLRALCARGACSLRASSVMPAVSLPCHVSMFYSVAPGQHGVLTNNWMAPTQPLSGLMEVGRAAGLKTAAVYNWEPLRDLSRPNSLAFSYFRDSLSAPDGDQVIADEASRYILTDRPDLLFVYFGTMDVAGHDHGFMSGRYLDQLERVDHSLGTLLLSLTPSTTVLTLADHGGHEHTHGTDCPEDLTIPWILAGPAIRSGYLIAGQVSLMDTAPTLARVLGLQPDPGWEGVCVDEAFI